MQWWTKIWTQSWTDTLVSSVRQPSTEFGPVSEVSALFEADKERFKIDTTGQYLGATGNAEALVVNECEYPQLTQPTQPLPWSDISVL